METVKKSLPYVLAFAVGLIALVFVVQAYLVRKANDQKVDQLAKAREAKAQKAKQETKIETDGKETDQEVDQEVEEKGTDQEA